MPVHSSAVLSRVLRNWWLIEARGGATRCTLQPLRPSNEPISFAAIWTDDPDRHGSKSGNQNGDTGKRNYEWGDRLNELLHNASPNRQEKPNTDYRVSYTVPCTCKLYVRHDSEARIVFLRNRVTPSGFRMMLNGHFYSRTASLSVACGSVNVDSSLTWRYPDIIAG